MKTEKETIDGLQVTTVQLPAMRAFNLLPRIGKILAPVIGGQGLSLDADVASLAPVIGAALAQLEASGAEELACDILELTTVVHADKIVALDSTERINAVFTGRLLTMIKVIAFSLRVNYADFLGSELVQKATAPVVTESG